MFGVNFPGLPIPPIGVGSVWARAKADTWPRSSPRRPSTASKRTPSCWISREGPQANPRAPAAGSSARWRWSARRTLPPGSKVSPCGCFSDTAWSGLWHSSSWLSPCCFCGVRLCTDHLRLHWADVHNVESRWSQNWQAPPGSAHAADGSNYRDLVTQAW